MDIGKKEKEKKQTKLGLSLKIQARDFIRFFLPS